MRSTRYIPDWHTTRQGHPLCHLRRVSWHYFRHHVILHQTLPCYRQPCSLPPSQTPTSTHGPSSSTTSRLFNVDIHTLLEYGSAASCIANPSRFVQWERHQMRLITKTLDLPNTLNHDILRRHADQPTIHERLLYLAKRWYSKAFENNVAQCDFIHKEKSRRIPDEIQKQSSIFSFLLVP